MLQALLVILSATMLVLQAVHVIVGAWAQILTTISYKLLHAIISAWVQPYLSEVQPQDCLLLH